MKTRAIALTVLAVLLWAAGGHARVEPPFSLNHCAWNATHIVVASEGGTIDGVFTVLESWYGDLEPGEFISIPYLAIFTVKDWRRICTRRLERNPDIPTHVTCDRMVMFLKKEKNETQGTEETRWVGAAHYPWISVAWIEQGEAYAFPWGNPPGEVSLEPLGLSENDLKNRVHEVIKTREELQKALSLPNPAQRAQALQPFTDSGVAHARKPSFDALGECGKDALPVLRKMLQAEFEPRWPHGLMWMFADAGGTEVGPELTEMLAKELNFWLDICESLEEGWLDGTGLTRDERESLAKRYYKTLNIIWALEKIKFEGCEQEVVAFRDFWNSRPQLAHGTCVVASCDAILAQLDQPEEKPDKEIHDNKQAAGFTPGENEAADTHPRASRSGERHHAGRRGERDLAQPRELQPTCLIENQNGYLWYLYAIPATVAILIALYLAARKRART
jgi:hypothetical protein